MSRKVFESGAARSDLLEIWGFIAYENPISGDPEAADRVIDAVQNTYCHLADFPFGIKIAPEGIFRAPVEGFQQYLILYRFDEEAVEILRVFRADLDWTRVIKAL